MYCFLKKDGSIKKNYLEVVDYLLTAKMRHQEIMYGRHDDIVEEYDCYETDHRNYHQPKRSQIETKVRDICSNFSCTIRPWYSLTTISIELHGDNVESMLDKLKNIYQREIS